MTIVLFAVLLLIGIVAFFGTVGAQTINERALMASVTILSFSACIWLAVR